GKVVREHRGGDDGADGGGDFKGKTDCDSIEEAVRRQASRADRAASPLFLGPWAFVAMWRDGPVQEHVGDKTDRNCGGDELPAQYRTPSSKASGIKSKKAAPIRAPALKPNIK